MSILDVVTLGDLVKAVRWPMICGVKDSTTIKEALDLCFEYNILSLPIQKKVGSREYEGIVSVLDMLTAIIFTDAFRADDVDEESLVKTEVFDWNVSDLLGVTEESKTLWEFPVETTLKKALEAYAGGIHRIIVTGETPSGLKFKRFLSQSDLVRWIARQEIEKELQAHTASNKEMDILLQRGSVQVGDILLTNPRRNKVVTMFQESTALQGMRLMRIHDVSSVAIVDAKGALLGSLSEGDIRGIKSADELKLLLLPVMSFLRKISPVRVATPDHVVAYADMEMRTVLKNIASAQVHRAFIIDEQTRPVACISLTDIAHHYCLFDVEGLTELKEYLKNKPVDTRALMKKVEIGSIVNVEREVVSISHDATIQDALNLMDKENVTSVATRAMYEDKNSYAGIINMFDVLTYVAFQKAFLHYDDRRSSVSTADLKSLGSYFDDFLAEKSTMDVPARNLLGFSKESKRIWSFKESNSLLYVSDFLSKGVHRMMVEMKDGQFRILSQSDVVDWLAKNIADLGALAQKSLAELGLGTAEKFAPVKTLSNKDSALTGFRKMTSHDVLALAVVDDDGKLTATLSSSDVRGLTMKNLKNVLVPVEEFLELQAKSYLKRDQVTCTAKDSLASVIEKVSAAKTHRAWCLDEEGKPVNVVSLSDIIYVFSPFNPVSGPMSDAPSAS